MSYYDCVAVGHSFSFLRLQIDFFCMLAGFSHVGIEHAVLVFCCIYVS